MIAKRIRATQPTSVGREPPKEIQLWSRGKNPTDYGVHVWNERAIGEVLARYNERGNPLLIDVEHNGASDEETGEPKVTGGYARLEVRSGAPWLVFDWSDYAREQIRTGQRRFLSPEYDVDKNTGEILALYRVSLVADPGTHRARMLAAANRKGRHMDPKLAAIMAILSSVAEPAAAIDAIKSLVGELNGDGGGDSGDGADPIAPVDAGAPDGGDGGGDDDEEKDKPKPVAAGAKTAKPVATAAGVSTVTAATTDGVRTINNATRDYLIVSQGDKLDPSIRKWASSQPLEVVRGLLDAAPAKGVARTRTAATRGNVAKSGAAAAAEAAEAAEAESFGITVRELQKCKAKKVDPAKYVRTKAASMTTGGN